MSKYLRIGIALTAIIAGGGWWYLNQPAKQASNIVQVLCEEKSSTIPPEAKPVVSGSEYLKDAQHVYLRRVDEAGVIPNADPTTFRVLPDIDEFGMDAHHVYYAGCELSGAHPETFTHLTNGTYGTDGSHVYWRSKMLADIDAAKFISLPRGYGKDDVLVYWEDERVEGADPATFQSFEDKTSCNGSCTITAQDKNHTYLLNKIVQ